MTLMRVAMGRRAAEPPGRELAFAWLLLVALPAVAGAIAWRARPR